jgi:putative transcriptional regulator
MGPELPAGGVRVRIISARLAEPQERRRYLKRTAKGKRKIDWSRAGAMSEAERHASAMADPDARPMTDEEWARAPRVPQVSVIRRALKLSQEQFAATFHIPIGTVRDWELGRYEPDAPARAYLRVIARELKTVRKALAARTKPRL